MTEYEMMALFSDFHDTAIQIVFGYVSILSAFLIMSYFASSKLNRVHVLIVLVLFTAICFLLITQLNLTRNLMAELNTSLLDTPNSMVGKFGTAPVVATQIITFLYNLVTFGGYIGCVVFFFYQRKQDSIKNDTKPSIP
jgi:hypothetical protein